MSLFLYLSECHPAFGVGGIRLGKNFLGRVKGAFCASLISLLYQPAIFLSDDGWFLSFSLLKIKASTEPEMLCQTLKMALGTAASGEK